MLCPGVVEDARQGGNEAVDLGFGDDQRWSQPNHVGRGRVDEVTGVARCGLGGFGVRRCQHDALEQSAAADIVDQRVVDRFNVVPQRLAQNLCAADQVLGRQRPHDGEGRRGTHRVAAEGAAVQAGGEQLRCWADGQDRPDR